MNCALYPCPKGQGFTASLIIVCSGGECSAEWNEAIDRALHIPKKKQRNLQLTLSEIFLCSLEFCKLHNERYNSEIAYAVHLLESMKENPKQYIAEWAVWKNVIAQTVTKYMESDEFDWTAELPTWPDN